MREATEQRVERSGVIDVSRAIGSPRPGNCSDDTTARTVIGSLGQILETVA
jgi:hypothetical protein